MVAVRMPEMGKRSQGSVASWQARREEWTASIMLAVAYVLAYVRRQMIFYRLLLRDPRTPTSSKVLLGAALGLLTAWLLVVARGIRDAGPASDIPRPPFGVPLYILSILAYVIGVVVCITVFVVVGPALLATVMCAGVFSAAPPTALVYG